MTKKLTKRENQIAELVANGFSEQEIAHQLFIAESTVHTHTKNIRRKINARSALDIVRFYIIENPSKFFIAIAFLFIHTMTVVINDETNFRRPSNRTHKRQAARKTRKLKNFVW